MAKSFFKAKPQQKFDPEDPFRIFQMDPPPGLTLAPQRRSYGIYAFFCLLGIFFVGGGVQLYRNFTAKRNLPPFVFVELRALDPDGHPVAGARVRFGKVDQGLTDSFGEWRRFLRLELGRQLSVSIAKNTSQGVLHAVKNITVPPTQPRQGELELKASIDLQFKGRARAAAMPSQSLPGREPRATTAQDSAAVSSPSSQSAASDAPLAGANSGVTRLDAGNASIESAAAVIPSKPAELATSRTTAAVLGPPQTLAVRLSEPESGHYGPLCRLMKERVVPAMKKLAESEGLRPDERSSFVLMLGCVAIPEGGGLIKADLSWSEGGIAREASFLRNFSKTVNDTAKALLVLTRSHVGGEYQVTQDGPKWLLKPQPGRPEFWEPAVGETVLGQSRASFTVASEAGPRGAPRLVLSGAVGSPCVGTAADQPCVVRRISLSDAPPVASWIPLRLKIPGGMPADFKIYAAGFAARPMAASEWEYWGEPGNASNITVLKGSRLLWRQRVTNRGVAHLSGFGSDVMARR